MIAPDAHITLAAMRACSGSCAPRRFPLRMLISLLAGESLGRTYIRIPADIVIANGSWKSMTEMTTPAELAPNAWAPR